MKRKISKIFGVGLALVLVLSLSLVMAVPVGADPANEVELETAGTSTAVWSTTPSGLKGNYCVKLTCPDSGLTEWSAAKVAYGETLATLVTYTKAAGSSTVLDVAFNVWATSEPVNYPMLWVDEDADGTVDTRINGGFDADVDGTSDTLPQNNLGAWCVGYKTIESDWQLRDYDEGVVSEYSGAHDTTDDTVSLAEYLAHADCANAIVEYIGVAYMNNADPAYVDDIIVDGVTYEMEPPVLPLDAGYYKVGGEPIVTIYDPAANADPMAIDFIGNIAAGTSPLHVVSTTDTTGDDVVLTETEADSGVFTGTFTLLGAAPADRTADEIVVSEGDTITLTYPDPDISDLIVTALVDDTAPEITIGFPADGQQIEDTMPEIKATYDDTAAAGSPSGIDKDSVEIIVDDVDVTEEDATSVSGTEVTYTPEDDLADGSHDVTVNVSDNAGNAAATASWSFSVVSWLEDSYGSATNTPSLDCLTAFGVGVFDAGDTADIALGRYTSNPETAPTFTTIENGFFDVRVLQADTTQIVIKFADDNITADSVAYFWDDVEGMWLECDDQGYSVANEWLWVKVRADTTPNIAELGGTPFAISGEPAVEDILAYYQGLTGDAEVVDTADLLTAANDWADEVVPPGFTESISTTQLIALANEWAATE